MHCICLLLTQSGHDTRLRTARIYRPPRVNRLAVKLVNVNLRASGFPNYFSALIYIKAKSRKGRLLKLLCALFDPDQCRSGPFAFL